tara:strand:- start:766 stop:1341 length:576 start_codon:yes stop_codon:yes gene_type:complete
MKPSDIKLNAEKHISERHTVKIERELDDGEDLSCFGYILDVSDGLILIQIEDDFLLDGYSIIPFHTVNNIRYNKLDQFHNYILKNEKIEESQYGLSKQIDLLDWQSVFESLKKHYKVISIEDEADEDSNFIIGRIIRVNKKSVSIQYLNALGRFDDNATNVKYEDITIVSFDNRYINIYSKYLTEPKDVKV